MAAFKTFEVGREKSAPILGVYSWSPRGKSLKLLIVMVLGFIAAQRFSIGVTSSFICIVPFVWAILSFKNQAQSSALAILAIFFSVDMSVLAGMETPSLIRYCIYLLGIWHLLYRQAIRSIPLLLSVTALIVYSLLTIVGLDMINGSQLWRDIQTFFLLSILFTLVPKQKAQPDCLILFWGVSGYLISDLVNFIWFKEVWYGDYMSYSSTKFFLIFPALFCLARGYFIHSVVLAGATLTVLVGYGGRYVFLCFVLALLYFFVRRVGVLKALLITVGLFLSAISLAFDDFSGFFEGYKALYSLTLLYDMGLGAFYYMDAIRFYESQIFFQQALPNLVFGNGFGSGLVDNNDLLSFVSAEETAFSVQELSSRQFFNFHDIWVDWGVRFGLAPTLLVIVNLLSSVHKCTGERKILRVVGLVGVISSFYGIGPLLISIFLLLHEGADRPAEISKSV